MRVGLIGDPTLIALHGADGDFAWGQLRVLRDGAPTDGFEPDVVLSLGDVPAAHEAVFGTCRHRAIWHVAPRAAADGIRTLGPGGDGLWRIAPLPVADSIFSLEPAPPSGVLVVGDDAALSEAAVKRLHQVGHDARARVTPTRDDLAGVGIVAIVAAPEQPLSPLAFVALASGRLLLGPSARPTFGLAAGVDLLVHNHRDELAKLADIAVNHPAAFESVISLGRVSAEAHRASTVYGRIAADLAAAG